jgi:hypothetical protein
MFDIVYSHSCGGREHVVIVMAASPTSVCLLLTFGYIISSHHMILVPSFPSLGLHFSITKLVLNVVRIKSARKSKLREANTTPNLLSTKNGKFGIKRWGGSGGGGPNNE